MLLPARGGWRVGLCASPLLLDRNAIQDALTENVGFRSDGERVCLAVLDPSFKLRVADEKGGQARPLFPCHRLKPPYECLYLTICNDVRLPGLRELYGKIPL